MIPSYGRIGMAREIASAIQWINRSRQEFEFKGYVVSDLSRLGPNDSHRQVLGDFSWIKKRHESIDALVIGVGSPSIRLKLAGELMQMFPTLLWPAIVHPTATIDLDSASLGQGCFIGAGVIATVNINLEPYALLNFGFGVLGVDPEMWAAVGMAKARARTAEPDQELHGAPNL